NRLRSRFRLSNDVSAWFFFASALTSTCFWIQIHGLIPASQRCHSGRVVGRQLQRTPAPIEQESHHTALHLSRDRDSRPFPEIHLFRRLDCDRGLLPADQGNQPQVAEREYPLVHSTIREGDGIVRAPFPVLPLPDRRDTGPQVDHAIADEDI